MAEFQPSDIYLFWLMSCNVLSVTHMINKWEGLLEDAVKMQRQLMRNTTVVFAFIEVSNIQLYYYSYKIFVWPG